MELMHKAGLALAALALAANTSAQAQVTEYTDRAAFTAAAPSLTTLDFAAANPGGTATGYNTAAGLTLGGVNFVGTENSGQYALGVAAPAFFSTYQGFTGDPTVLQAGDNNATSSPILTITLPTGTTAVGTGLYTLVLGDGSANTVESVDFTLYSGAVSLGMFTVPTFEKPTVAFAGFTSTMPITSIQVVSENNSIANLSNFAFGPSPAPVPEASTLASTGLLLCLGLGGLAWGARRRRATLAE